MSELRVSHAIRDGALVHFAFGPDPGGGIRIDCPRLAGPERGESWSEFAPAGADADFGLVAVEVEEAAYGGIEGASAEAYRRLLARVRPSAHPFLLRIWNYFGAINQGEGDAERYRRFCVGRAAAVDAMFNDPPPAATAIGTPRPAGTIQLIALCTRRPGLALENPRQTPAWQYPREYGPVPPGFSRGALVGSDAGLRLLASGTASIVGHVSQHPRDAAAQLRESLANLEVLLHEGELRSGHRFALDRFDALRVYLRDPADLDAVRDALRERVPLERVLFLQGDICRRELLVELEGVFAAH
jgi:chorismate lyase / 3-hydroxybenzoate synthase